MGRVRDYREIAHRLRALPRGEWRVESVGRVWGYPFFFVRREIDKRVPTVCLTGGIHGEEPGSVEGVLRWLENGEWAKWRVNWFVLPCINPYGWERNQRHNAQRRDINRQFRNPGVCPEANLVVRLMNGRRFLFVLDHHEDVDSPGYYLYELWAGPPFLGERIVAAVSKVIRINHCKVIDGTPATGPGLIRREASIARLKRRARWPMAYHLFLNGMTHILGSETPVCFPLLQRATAHNVALRTALSALAHPG
ncbi:MAG TPA: M14 family metallocarboxypeptidase [Verrucomicrobiae bacterium]|nr:M14 family metallocarboxypeptidase [Verrucomicrobiae bacterium]